MKTRVTRLIAVCLAALGCFVPDLGAEQVVLAAANANSEFYIIYTDNYDNGNGADLFITSRKSTYGKVEIPGVGFEQAFTVQADSIISIDLPLAAEVSGSDIVAKLGIRVTANDEITVYLLNPGEPVYTNDAYVALPVTDLGTEYIVMAWQDTIYERGFPGEGPSELAIVAPFDNTQVTVIPKVTTGNRIEGVPYTIALNQFDTYTLQSDDAAEDLTGTVIRATSPIAVFSGNRCADVPSSSFVACDHLVEQMLPVSAWGKVFVASPMASRSGGDIIRILAAEDNTTVNITGNAELASVIRRSEAPVLPLMRPDRADKDGMRDFDSNLGSATTRVQPSQIMETNLVQTLDRAHFFQVTITGPIELVADKPILVAQYATGQAYGGNGDPLMILVVPAEQFRSKYTFATPAGYLRDFVKIVIANDSTSTVILDKVAISASLFTSIGTSGFAVADIELTAGSHTVTAGAPFGVYAYGFTDYTSYGYPGGLGSTSINPNPGFDKIPIIVIPGIGGTAFSNNAGDLWVSIERLCEDARNHGNKATSEFLDVLRLDESGTAPLLDLPEYTSVVAGSILRTIGGTCELAFPWGKHAIDPPIDVYGGLVNYLQGQGYELDKNLFLFGYDWRRDIRETKDRLNEFIDAHRGVGKVNIIAHSMGGLVARNYILDQQLADKVENLFVLGSPLLGAPQMFHGMYFGDDFGINAQIKEKTWGFPIVRLINEEHIPTLTRNWPGAYELLPGSRYFDVYPSGYVQEDRDVTGDNVASGALGYGAVKSWLEAVLNDQLVAKAEEFRRSSLEGFDIQGTNGVSVTLFVGSGFGTKERIRFWQESTWFGMGTENHQHWWYSNGDGTVPENSADLQDADDNFRGETLVYYVKAKHGDLPLNPHLQQQIMRVLSGDTTPVNNSISITNHWPLEGTWVEVSSPVELHIYDALGNHLGPNQDGIVEFGISSVQYDVIGHDKSVFLPEGITYTVVLTGTDTGEFDLRARDVVSDSVVRTVLFKNIEVKPDTTASVVLDPATGYEMAIDNEGDGTTDVNIPPTNILDDVDSQDSTAPSSTIRLDGTQDSQGSYVDTVLVTIDATDNQQGSGILRVEYSLDGGASFEEYSAPFYANIGDISAIYAKAIDNAGNEQSPYAVMHISRSLYLTKTGNGTGRVVSIPDGINCGNDCGEAYLHGTAITLTATADAGSIFSGWDGACNGIDVCTLVMDASHSVTAMITLPPTVQFSSATYSATENAGQVAIAVNLSAPSGFTVTIEYATGGDAFSANAVGQLNFAPGETTQSFAIPVVDDTLDEADAVIPLILLNPVNATLGATAAATLTVVDDDPPPTVQFSSATYSATENAGQVAIAVNLSAPSGFTVTVGYSSSDDAAQTGTENAVTSGTLTYAPGETEKSFSVPILDDLGTQPERRVNLVLSNPVNATLGELGAAVLTILDVIRTQSLYLPVISR